MMLTKSFFTNEKKKTHLLRGIAYSATVIILSWWHEITCSNRVRGKGKTTTRVFERIRKDIRSIHLMFFCWTTNANI